MHVIILMHLHLTYITPGGKIKTLHVVMIIQPFICCRCKSGVIDVTRSALRLLTDP